MRRENLKTRVVFEGIPMMSSVFTHPLAHTMYLCETGTMFRDRQGATHAFFGGAEGDDLADVRFVAQCEVLERLLATRHFADAIRLASGYPAHGYIDGRHRGFVDSAHVLIRERSTDMAWRTSASGLGLHTDEVKAVQHAARELAERHLLCKVWYEAQPIFECCAEEPLDGGYSLRHYAVSSSTPFAIAVVTSKSRDVFFAGSSFSDTLLAAMNKAKREAMHMLVNHLFARLNSGVGNETGSKERIGSLVGAPARTYLEHFLSRVIDASEVNAMHAIAANEECPLTQAGIDPHEAIVIPIARRNAFSLVRVAATSALSKEQCRATHPQFADPFC